MKNRRPQAKDITDERALDALRATVQPWGVSLLWDVEKLFPEFPPKVVRAKLDAMVRRGLVDGCTCGCRGDFAILARDAA